MVCADSGCDCAKKPHKIKVIDWEVNELARNVMKGGGTKGQIREKIRQKLFDWMKERQLYFFMGTYFKYGTWIIIGIFYPDKEVAGQEDWVVGTLP